MFFRSSQLEVFCKDFQTFRATVFMATVCSSPRSEKFNNLLYFVYIQEAEEAENTSAKYEAKIPSYQKKIQDIKVSFGNCFFNKNYLSNYGYPLTTLQLHCNHWASYQTLTHYILVLLIYIPNPAP